MNQTKVVSESDRKPRQVTGQFASRSAVTRKFLEPSEKQTADSSAKTNRSLCLKKGGFNV